MTFKVDYLHEEILELTKECDHKQLALWASNCANHVMYLFSDCYPNDERPNEALNACISWINNNISVSEARKFAFKAHDAGREITNKEAIAVARACGHACATAHIKTHAVYAATYAAKAIIISKGNIEKEREWQYSRLTELLNVERKL